MAVKGPNHQMRTRIRGLTVLFALIGFGLVGVRLLYMQVFNHDFYVQQATALQTRDTFITPNRGKIYDANMQVLAESAAVERITVDPKAVVDESKVKKGITAESQQQTLATILSETLADYAARAGFVFHLAGIESFGVAYLTPFASNAGMQKEGHTVLRQPLPRVKLRERYLNTRNRRNQG